MGNNVFLSGSEFSSNVWLDMNNNIVTNLPAPVNPGDGVNKAYADTSISSNLTAPFIKVTPIPGLTATNVQDALSELNKDAGDCLPLSGGTMSGSINMNNNSITDLSTPTETQKENAANVQYVNTYVDTHITSIVQPAITKIQQDITTTTNSITSLENSLKEYLPLTGGTMTGDLQMGNHAVTGVTTPTDSETTNAANVEYVNNFVKGIENNLTPQIDMNKQDIATCNQKISSLESSLTGYLPVAGGTMTGDLQLDNHTVTGLTTPGVTDTTNAANVQYVNNALSGVHFSPFYTALQVKPPSIGTADSPWINPTGEGNSFISSSNSSSFFSFDSSYVNWYLLQIGIYLLSFSIISGPTEPSNTINIYLHDAVTNSKRLVTYVNYTLYGGGYASAIVPITGTLQPNQFYLTVNAPSASTEAHTPATNVNLIWLPTK